MLCPQNGDRIVTIDYVTSFHPMYNVNYARTSAARRATLAVGALALVGTHSRLALTACQHPPIPHCKNRHTISYLQGYPICPTLRVGVFLPYFESRISNLKFPII